MTFEEDFPSLKDKQVGPVSREDWYDQEDIQEHCIDKQRVKEVLNKYVSYVDDNSYNTVHKELQCDEFEFKDLLKELGLGEKG